MANKPPMLNIDGVATEAYGRGGDFSAKLGRIGRQLGMRKLGCTLVELEPGKRAWPYHLHYGDEEVFVVLSGEGTLRYDGESHRVRSGDVIFTPPGEGTAHQIVNTSDAPLRYLAFSTMTSPEVCFYPDSGKYGAYFGDPVRGEHRFIAHRDADTDYWEGEGEVPRFST